MLNFHKITEDYVSQTKHGCYIIDKNKLLLLHFKKSLYDPENTVDLSVSDSIDIIAVT